MKKEANNAEFDSKDSWFLLEELNEVFRDSIGYGNTLGALLENSIFEIVPRFVSFRFGSRSTGGCTHAWRFAIKIILLLVIILGSLKASRHSDIA